MPITRAMDRKPGDVVWAFAYLNDDRVRGQKLRQMPVRGILLSDYHKGARNAGVCIDPDGYAGWFVPFGKNGQPVMSSAVRAESRKYADTKEEAVTGYNLAVNREIEKNEAAIRKHYGMLIPALDRTQDENGDYKTTAVYRADMAVTADEILSARNDDLVPKETCAGELMSWDSFIRDVENGGLTDYDGAGDLIIDGRASSNESIWITMQMVNIIDRYLVPFERIPEIFKDHKVEVMWFNK